MRRSSIPAAGLATPKAAGVAALVLAASAAFALQDRAAPGRGQVTGAGPGAGAVAGAAPKGDVEAPELQPVPPTSCPPCADDDPCTIDSCDATTGTCRHDPLVCDDHDPCTLDNCVASSGDPGAPGRCLFAPMPDGEACDDGNSCTVGEACRQGVCRPDAVLDPGEPCDDGNPCTIHDLCDAAAHCVGNPLPAGTGCDDGNACTIGDVCVATASGGVICQGSVKGCDDGDLCTRDLCDPATGDCRHSAVDCDDRNACTADACDPATGACLRSNVTGVCDDGNKCTFGDHCENGVCTSTPVTCSNGCLVGFCSPNSGFCSFSPGSCPQPGGCFFSICLQNGQCETCRTSARTAPLRTAARS